MCVLPSYPAPQRNKVLLTLGAAAVAAGAVWSVCPRPAAILTRAGLGGGGPITLVDRKVAVPLQLVERRSITHDTEQFRFALPSPDHVLGNNCLRIFLFRINNVLYKASM